MVRKYTRIHTFRCDNETQMIIDYLLNSTDLSKSELIRECIRTYVKI